MNGDPALGPGVDSHDAAQGLREARPCAVGVGADGIPTMQGAMCRRRAAPVLMAIQPTEALAVLAVAVRPMPRIGKTFSVGTKAGRSLRASRRPLARATKALSLALRMALRTRL